jgi:hypothetical protein
MIAGLDPFGYTLEDVLRGPGIKIPGQTAIPTGEYKITLYDSPRFKRLLPMLNDVPGFSHILIHGGNTETDTEGCILIAKSKKGTERIYNSLSANLVQMLMNAGGEHSIRVMNP